MHGFAPFCTLLNTLASTVVAVNTVTKSILYRLVSVVSIIQFTLLFKYFHGSGETTKILNLEIIKFELC